MNHFRLRLCSSLAFGLLFHAVAGAAPRQEWTDAGAGFSAGTLGNAGQNLYVNRRGELEVIRRYDLDGNGHLDLLFNSTHDTFHAVPATMVTANDRSLSATKFGVDGSSQVVPSDLNRDGFTDLVFMPNRQNIQKQRSSIIIAWGGSDGWSTARLTRQLPVNGAADLAVGDFNRDGWPDLLTLNSEGWLHGQPQGQIIRVYWGSSDGFFLTNFQDLGVPGAIKVAAGSFGAQRQYTAAVLTATGTIHYLGSDANSSSLHLARAVELPPTSAAGGEAVNPQCLLVEPGFGPEGDVLWIGTDAIVLHRVSTTGRDDGVRSIEAGPATHLALGRLDDDDWPDLVLTQLELIYPLDPDRPDYSRSVTVLWGAADGFSKERSISLAIPNAIAASVGDLNGDRHGDLLVSVHQGDTSMDASSLIYLGDGGRRLPAEGLPAPTHGAQGVAITQLTPQAQPVAVFANTLYATLDSAVPLYLYWGSDDDFSTISMVKIPNLSGYKSSASDLNADGHVDMIVINGGDVGEETIARAPDAGVNIYWGGDEGNISGPGPTRFDRARRQILRETHLGSINVADLNGDGFLDLVLGAFESSKPETDLVIYHGSAKGFDRASRTAIPVPDRSIGCLIADFNHDGHLDIVVGGFLTDRIFTFWGGPEGHNGDNKTILPYSAPIDLEAADLNGDGWLDLLVASYYDRVSGHHDSGLSILWGSDSGWRQSNSQWLPAMTPIGIAVADLDDDGYMDIVSPHYHGELSREHLPSYIYWGSETGYASRDRTSLTVDSASEVTIADFNGDGRLDLAFAAHSLDPGHLLETPIYYNDGRRFSAPEVRYLPVIGPHYGWVQDIGNIYHRRHEESFDSRVFRWSEGAGEGRVEVDAAMPFDSRVAIQVRSAADEQALSDARWVEAEDGRFRLSGTDRTLQYRLVLHSANGDSYPLVRRVRVSVQ